MRHFVTCVLCTQTLSSDDPNLLAFTFVGGVAVLSEERPVDYGNRCICLRCAKQVKGAIANDQEARR